MLTANSEAELIAIAGSVACATAAVARRVVYELCSRTPLTMTPLGKAKAGNSRQRYS
jgi:hypothetical protein